MKTKWARLSDVILNQPRVSASGLVWYNVTLTVWKNVKRNVSIPRISAQRRFMQVTSALRERN